MSAEQLEALRVICPDAEPLTDGGKMVVHLPSLKVTTPGGVEVVNALLYPHGIHNYTTRLFLDRQIPAKAGWNSYSLCGSTWMACSWNEISPNLPWTEILANHLRAFA